MQAVKKTTDRQSLRWLFRRADSARTWVIISIGLGFGSGLLLIVQAGLLANIIQGVFMDGLPRNLLLPLFGAYLAVILLRAAFCWGREVTGFYAGAKVRTEVRLAVMEHIVALGPAFTGRQRTGALSTIVLEHVEGLHDFFAHYLPQLALAVMIPAAILAFVFPLSWAAGAIFLMTAPLIPIFMILIGMGAESISQRNYQALARLSAHFLDVLQGITTLKLFGRSRGEEDTIARVSGDYRKQTMRVLRVAFLSSAVLEFFSSIAIALVAVYLGMHYLGYFQFGDYGHPLNLAGGFFILILAPDFYMPLRDLGTHYHARAEAVGAAKEIVKLLSVERSDVPGVPGTLPDAGTVRVECRDVHLAYEEGRRPALQGSSFTVGAGEHVALVGPSGVGKSTILNLLMGFVPPDRGSVLVNGVPLTDLRLQAWRDNLAWIGQNPVLFHGTIRENILLGRPEATDEEIERAARSARALDFCRHLPGGLDTPVGEQGLGLSRGQAQRVALARAFLKGAPLLLLDEPTAGLDAENEHLVIKAMEELFAGRTVLLVTHRLYNIERADRILVLADGRIAEQGRYHDLMAAGGILYKLVHRKS